MALVLGENLNATLLEGGYFDNSDAILISQVPGVGINAWPLPADFAFDTQNDCQLYSRTFNGGMQDGIQICIASNDSYLVVGTQNTNSFIDSCF